MRQNIHTPLFIFLYTCLFTFLFFIGREIFFPSRYSEEKYVEPTLWEYYSDLTDEGYTDFDHTHTHETSPVVHELIYESFQKRYDINQREKVSLRYIPSSFLQDIQYSYTPLVEVFLYRKDILSHINQLGVFLYKNRDITRWRMKSGNIHMYGVDQMSDSEFLSVLLHEFGHYYDIYSLPGNTFWDVSNTFYDISWSSATIMKKWARSEDFVSGYSMTNKYEDFAESYMYYILHNEDFIYKSLSSDALKEKYNYMKEYIFTQNQFLQEDFSSGPIKEYYWDVTKIEVDVKKFLQYLQEDI